MSTSGESPQKERSAGFILFLPETPRQFLLLDYGSHWDFPKGHVEPGETDLDAAIRETAEETGITQLQRLPGFARELDYYFRGRKKQVIHKTVIFFLASTEQTNVRLSHEHVEYAFLPFEKALPRLTYPAAKQLLRAAVEFIESPVTPSEQKIKPLTPEE